MKRAYVNNGQCDDMKAYHRKYWKKRRQKIIDYLGGVCVKCGTTEDLQFDHIKPSDKTLDIKRNVTLESIKAEVDKCQLLCKTHHLEKTISEKKPYTHGTIYAWMRVKCKCDTCAKAKRVWYDKRNAKRRG